MSEETKPTAIVKDARFGFVLDFGQEPTEQTFCEAVIAVFQALSVGCLQKEAVKKSIEDAKNEDSNQFVVEGYLDPNTKTIEASISLLKKEKKEEGKIIKPQGLISLNRAQRRKNGK